MEDGFYHENPSIAHSKLFPPNWHYKPCNLAKPQSYYATILDITNFVKFKHFKLHSAHSEPTYSICIIQKIIHPLDWGQPLHKPISFPSTQLIRISVLHIHIGITSKPILMPSSYKTQIIATHSYSTFIIPRNLPISLFGSSNGGIIFVVILTSSKVIFWLKTVTSFSNNIFNLLLLKWSFLPLLFFVQSSLFHGYVHGSMTTTSQIGIQFLSVNSKLNGEIPL